MSTENTEFIDYLPEMFKTHPVTGEPSFLVSFIKTFEALLTGRNDAIVNGESKHGLDEIIENFVNYLDPALVPVDPEAELLSSEFLNYLAKWVALDIDQNWEPHLQREWLRKIVPLYKKRGTRDGIQEYLSTFAGNQVIVDEPLGGFQIANPDNSIVGENTFIADAPAYFFRVRFNYGYPPEPFNISDWLNIHRRTKAIVDLEKPAHTDYKLYARTPGIIIAERSTVSIDTLIWENSGRT